MAGYVYAGQAIVCFELPAREASSFCDFWKLTSCDFITFYLLFDWSKLLFFGNVLIKDKITLSVSKNESFWCSGFQWMSLWRSDKLLLTLSVFPLIMCPSHFFFLFFNVLNSSLSTPISCSTLSFVLFIILPGKIWGWAGARITSIGAEHHPPSQDWCWIWPVYRWTAFQWTHNHQGNIQGGLEKTEWDTYNNMWMQ